MNLDITAPIMQTVHSGATLQDIPLPTNLEAERAVIGAVLLDNSAYSRVSNLSEVDFSLDAHRVIWRSMCHLLNSGFPADIITLMEELNSKRLLSAASGAAYITSCTDGLPRFTNVEHYARIVKNKATLRCVIKAADALTHEAAEPSANVEAVLSRWQGLLSTTATLSAGKIESWEEIPDIFTVEAEPNKWTVEKLLPRVGVTLLAGEAGVGKTWFGLDLAVAIASGKRFLGRLCEQRPVLYLDRENPPDMVRKRLHLLEYDLLSNLKVWGLGSGEEPPMIGDHRLRKFAAQWKPLIVFDSFIRFHSADENSASEVRTVMEELRKLATAGASVLLFHHKAKSETSKYRGSSDIIAGVDVAMSLSREGSGLLQLTCIKNRLEAEFSFTIRRDEVTGAHCTSESGQTTRRHDQEARLEETIRREPGITQTVLIQRSGIAKGRARRILNNGTGSRWRTKSGARNSRMYFPIEAAPLNC